MKLFEGVEVTVSEADEGEIRGDLEIEGNHLRMVQMEEEIDAMTNFDV